MWFLQVVALIIVLGLVFVLGLSQGEAQERERIENQRRLEAMGGKNSSNKYF
ncbi:hypothetical protein LES9216_00025 [Leuconostoc suionicum]|uniref:Uncharacterized protein n=1 Tax=Leuconostoc suionicum TaxID=1511761 RepID=A0A2N9K6C3_9LACO|nr:hypothetical protein [Leuconostoc suionicum]SPD94476.1 hypothetical protein LES8486_01660 [Leuconostoc suionicum]SPE06138.1 hypothetical protein LES9216_00025 [Leuconostoc suionicum]SPH04909.1 hypothetical protein LES8484_01660 [Leuconostoc suionicum]